MPIVSLSDWNQFLSDHPNAHLLQTGEWGELKSAFGWKPVRIVNGECGRANLISQTASGFYDWIYSKVSCQLAAVSIQPGIMA